MRDVRLIFLKAVVQGDPEYYKVTTLIMMPQVAPKVIDFVMKNNKYQKEA